MMEQTSMRRSPLLLDRATSTLLVVDVQEKLLPLIRSYQRIVWNIDRLIQGAQVLEVPVVATEQYPRGLGHTVSQLKERLAGKIPEKSLFSCRECNGLVEQSSEQNRHQFVLVGIEAHVCVQQTALDFLGGGFDVFVVCDAVGSRFSHDYRIALERMAANGVTLTTTESVLFEWCEMSGTESFKQISRLVKQPAPATGLDE